MDYSDYRDSMVRQFWDYKQSVFGNTSGFFEEEHPRNGRPPVFQKEYARLNVPTDPHAKAVDNKAVYSQIPISGRHRWFGSMSSSQALALSVFGNLKSHGKLSLLRGSVSEDGRPLFPDDDFSMADICLEFSAHNLGEPRPTSIDVMVQGRSRVAIECKLTEPEIGACSRPRLENTDTVRDREYCDGSYHVQIGRHDRCPLSESGTLYWQYVPEFFDWNPRSDLTPCPLNRNYQLVRTVLTVAAVPEGSIPGHAVLLHDARNPAFQPEGEGYMAFCETSDSLLNKDLLLRCTWQNLLNHLRRGGLMPWLSEALERKYGL